MLGRIVLWLLGFPLFLLVSAFAYETWNSATHAFRLTVEVATPDGIKSGSSVIHVGYTSKASWIPQSRGASGRAFGDAVFVDLGQGKNVIALLGFGPNGSEHKLERLASLAFGRDEPFWHLEAPNWVGSFDLNPSLIPTLVTFGDLADPTTARVVDITDAAFADAFGPGYRLERVTLTMVPVGIAPFRWVGLTGTPVTRGIEKKLPWWGQSGRPAAKAWRAWFRRGLGGGGSVEPETLFTR